MSSAVLDSSAVLAVLFAEPGAELVNAHLAGALCSMVNAAEVASVLAERGMPSRAAQSLAFRQPSLGYARRA